MKEKKLMKSAEQAKTKPTIQPTKKPSIMVILKSSSVCTSYVHYLYLPIMVDNHTTICPPGTELTEKECKSPEVAALINKMADEGHNFLTL